MSEAGFIDDVEKVDEANREAITTDENLSDKKVSYIILIFFHGVFQFSYLEGFLCQTSPSKSTTDEVPPPEITEGDIAVSRKCLATVVLKYSDSFFSSDFPTYYDLYARNGIN